MIPCIQYKADANKVRFHRRWSLPAVLEGKQRGARIVRSHVEGSARDPDAEQQSYLLGDPDGLLEVDGCAKPRAAVAIEVGIRRELVGLVICCLVTDAIIGLRQLTLAPHEGAH